MTILVNIIRLYAFILTEKKASFSSFCAVCDTVIVNGIMQMSLRHFRAVKSFADRASQRAALASLSLIHIASNW